jgi:hypothetical protein
MQYDGDQGADFGHADMGQQHFNMGSGMNNENVKFTFSGNGFDGF